MADNRPTGRKVTNSGKTTNVNKRGSGLGTGKVSNTDYSGRTGGSGNIRPSAGGSTNMKRAIGGGSLGTIIIIAIIFFALRSCGSNQSSSGGLTSGLLNSVTGGNSAASTVISLLGAGTDYTTSPSDYTASTAVSTAASANKVDTTVAKGSRSKFTTLKGNGKDTITILVYMCGTDLESQYGMASSDLGEMCASNLSDKINIIVYTGGCKKWKTSGISTSTNQIYQVSNGGLKCLEKDMGAKAMTKPETLTEFIKYGADKFPADRLCLIFWDHGGGSLSGYGYDEKFSNSGSMTLAGINTALKNAGKKYDFIGFDACLMATLENGLMLADYADYMIASEETEPGIGWYYTNWLNKLSADTSMPTVDLGKIICDDFVSVCNSKCAGQGTTLSVTDLAELENTVPDRLSAFASSTSDLIKNDEYKTISNARSNTREFSPSSKIDQIDLMNFADNLGTDEAKALSKVLSSAVKYNRTSSNMTDSYGLSIYFPYKKASKVDSAINTYDQIGMDSEYAKCIKEFASLEVSGQVSGGGSNSVLSSLLGSYSGSSQSSGGSMDSILSMLSGLSGGGSSYSTADGVSTSLLGFLGEGLLSTNDRAQYIADNYFDASQLKWTKGSDGGYRIVLPEDQWSLVQDIDLNVLYDDGEGYIDLGMDNVFDFDNEGNLLGDYDGSWLAINDHIVAYYRTATNGNVNTGYIPAFLNGDRVEINVEFSDRYPNGYITGVTYVYVNGETETKAKSMIGLSEGDKLDFICDYYDYDGNYSDSYYLGDTMTLSGSITLSNININDPDALRATYRFTDIYNQSYWTPVIP